MAARKKAKKTSAKQAKRTVVAKPAKKSKVARKAAPKKVAPKKAAPKKAAPKKAAPKKVAPKKVAPKPKKAAARKPMRREDHAGHLDPQYAADLLRQSGHPDADPEGFVVNPRSKDTLVEDLGEEFVQEVTSAEYTGEDRENAPVAEERGGPFVETSGATEFAEGTDASNPKSATREPFPRT